MDNEERSSSWECLIAQDEAKFADSVVDSCMGIGDGGWRRTESCAHRHQDRLGLANHHQAPRPAQLNAGCAPTCFPCTQTHFNRACRLNDPYWRYGHIMHACHAQMSVVQGPCTQAYLYKQVFVVQSSSVLAANTSRIHAKKKLTVLCTHWGQFACVCSTQLSCARCQHQQACMHKRTLTMLCMQMCR